MNLHEIISDACAILHLGTEASMMQPYAVEFQKFANDAVIEISRKQRQVRTDIVELNDKQEFPLSDLERMCLKVVSIQDMQGRDLMWNQTAIGTGVIHVILPLAVIVIDEETPIQVRVMYQFRPARMTNPEDVPELPEFAHDAIPYFIAAQHMFSQGGNNSGMGQMWMNQFQQMLQNMPFPYYGDMASKKLHNYNKGLI